MDSRWIKVDYILILQGTVMEKYVYQFLYMLVIYKYNQNPESKEYIDKITAPISLSIFDIFNKK